MWRAGQGGTADGDERCWNGCGEIGAAGENMMLIDPTRALASERSLVHGRHTGSLCTLSSQTYAPPSGVTALWPKGMRQRPSGSSRPCWSGTQRAREHKNEETTGDQGS
jgi:hypothetical protein